MASNRFYAVPCCQILCLLSHSTPLPPPLSPLLHCLCRFLDMPEWTALMNESGLYHRYFTLRCECGIAGW